MKKERIKFYEADHSRDIYTMKNKSYIKVNLMGKGSFGKVIKVKEQDTQDKKDSKYFAIKISNRFRLVSMKDDSSQNVQEDEKPIEPNFVEIRELIILDKMKKNSHPNVMYLIDYTFCEEDRTLWILMDYFPTNLKSFFHANKNNPNIMNENFLKSIVYQILNGVNHLHQNMVIHRDLKLENLLYDEEKNLVRITDFGLSRQFDCDVNTKFTNAGFYPYKPPEIVLGLTHYSTEVDIWSVGCIIVEILTGKILFGEDSSLGVLKLMINIFGTFDEDLLPGFENFPNSKYLNDIPTCTGVGLKNFIAEKKLKIFKLENDMLYDLIEKMLTVDPTKRINAKECLSHPWFLNLN